MPRLSSQELQKAKRVKQKEREKELNAKQREQELAVEQRSRSQQLVSVTDAIYEEMDKLNKKAPAMPVSKLTLDKVNRAIISVKALLKDEKDEFVDEIEEFFPAGDMPEYRDVTLVLSQLKAGLSRFRESNRTYWSTLRVRGS